MFSFICDTVCEKTPGRTVETAVKHINLYETDTYILADRAKNFSFICWILVYPVNVQTLI